MNEKQIKSLKEIADFKNSGMLSEEEFEEEKKLIVRIFKKNRNPFSMASRIGSMVKDDNDMKIKELKKLSELNESNL